MFTDAPLDEQNVAKTICWTKYSPQENLQRKINKKGGRVIEIFIFNKHKFWDNIFELNMSISDWSSYTGGSADVKWSKKDLLDRIEEGENLSETSANGLNFMHVACRQGQVFTVP